MPSPTHPPADVQDAGPVPSGPAYVHALRRSWPLVVLAAAVAATAAFAVSTLVLPPVYRSSATVILNRQAHTLPDAGVPIDPLVDDQSLGETFAQLAQQPVVRDKVARELGLRPSQLTERMVVHAVPRTPLVVISFDASTPAAAARGAQAYTSAFVLTTQRTTFLPGRALVVSRATRPTEPVSPRPLLNTLVGGLTGLLLGLAVLLGRESRRPVRDEPAFGAAATLLPKRGPLEERNGRPGS